MIYQQRPRALKPALIDRRLAALIVALILAACGNSSPVTDGSDSSAAGSPAIKVLSNRADLISGGDALVEVLLPAGVDSSAVKVDLDGRDVTSQFALRPNGRYMGLVTGLAERANVLTARLPNGRGARITITNYPNGGPIFAGEQIQPWPCLEGVIDAQCNRPVSYQYKYKSTSSIPCAQPDVPPGCGFKDYDPQNPPSDVATTTTDQGKTVPYIVRVEKGSQDRGQYLLAVLFDPAKDWQPWASQDGWNNKIFNVGGSGCDMRHGESEAPPEVMDDGALSRGFLVWSTALSHNTLNCNLVVQAESLMMAKERITEVYGPIRYSIGSGGSGGSIKQQQAANSYPGIFDGILPAASFPDTWSTMQEVDDCALFNRYFLSPQTWAPGVVWTPIEMATAAGHQNNLVCQSWENFFGFDQVMNPEARNSQDAPVTATIPVLLGGTNCNVPAEQMYDAQTNPTGVRCSLQDYMSSILGLRPESAWGPIERQIGRGFANKALDNVGVQYGLSALKVGQISPAQFIDLNTKVGSHDIDYVWQAGRVTADPAALTVAYRGGLINQANNMRLPIIDLRGNDNFEIHHLYRSWSMRARLDRSNGHHDNQVIWLGAIPLQGDTQSMPQALTVMDQWLAGIEADQSSLAYEAKVAKHKPEGAKDRCTNGLGQDLTTELCSTLFPLDASPRIVAGQPFTDDVVKCQLKPLLMSDYFPLQFTDAEWGQLQQIFPQGVCDYARPGVEQQATLPWQTYSAGPGGQPMAEAPVSEAF